MKKLLKTHTAQGTDDVSNLQHAYTLIRLGASGRGWQADMLYAFVQEVPTSIVVDVLGECDGYIKVQLPAEVVQLQATDWAKRPYVRVDGTRNPNIRLSLGAKPLGEQYAVWEGTAYVKKCDLVDLPVEV